MKTREIYPTLLVKHVWPESLMNDALNYVKWLREQDPEGAIYSNRGGCWHSRNDDFLKNVPDINLAFTAMFMELAALSGFEFINKLHLGAWAMVYPPGGYSEEHDHKDHDFAGVVYLQGNRMGHSQLRLKDPYARRGDHVIYQRTGYMVVFPGYLKHYVPPNESDYDRITISCNCRVEEVPDEENSDLPS